MLQGLQLLSPPCPLRNGPLLPPCQTSFRSLPFGLKRCFCSTLLGALRLWRPETTLQGQRSLSTLCRALTLRLVASSQHTRNSGNDITLWPNKLLCVKMWITLMRYGFCPSTASVKVWSTQRLKGGVKTHCCLTQLRLEAPHMKNYVELEGEQGCRVPLSIGTPVEAGRFFWAELCGAKTVA